MRRTPIRDRLRRSARELRNGVRGFAYRGDQVSCPLCQGTFRGWVDERPFGRCPRCGAATRSRVLSDLLERRPELLPTDQRCLHFAPEECLRRRIAPLLGEGYVTTDLRRTDVTTQQDITRMTFADGSFGTIVCSHVLEHIPDDRGALSELARVLRPGGHLLVQVPFNHHGLTDEDPSVTDPEERLRRWGELDHLRLYGSDLVDRMTSAGFDVDTILVESGFPRELQERHGLAPDQVVFVGRRRG